jgi:peptidoglycan pentaglycine glycine transferase (the first glycine)
MENNSTTFIQQNSPDGGFLQSEEWRRFQESVGHKTYNISTSSVSRPLSGLEPPSPYKGEGNIEFHANIIEHTLPVVGKYFYIPRGPIINYQLSISNKFSIFNDQFTKLIELAKKENAGWIRIEPATDEILAAIRSNNIGSKIVKAPHDMQPKELFIIDITKPEEQLLAEMKAKTRYNIKLAQKHGVEISNEENISDFIRLTKIMAERQGISTHPENYYRKMIEMIPGNMLKMYVAKFNGNIIAANLVAFFGGTATYLHGASDDKYKNLMAPYLLQWQQILDAKALGCERYDFGGVKTREKNSWEGITRFKTSFSPKTEPLEFPGSYDIIISPVKYWLYRSIQRIKNLIK